MINILEYLEYHSKITPQKTLFCDQTESYTYQKALELSRAVGTCIGKRSGAFKKPVAVIAERGALSPVLFLGVVYSGNFYVVIDSAMPVERIKKIFETLNPVAVLCDERNSDKTAETGYKGTVIPCKEALDFEADSVFLNEIRRKASDTDPLYTLFTSGSTGVPKGAVICHRSVMAYAEWTTDTFGFDENTVFGNQTPFYFSMSVLDLFSTLKCGGTLCVIPKMLFSFPIKLIEYLNAMKVNTLYWVPSALCIIANWRVLDYAELSYVKKVLFAGEVMPAKQLNYWIKKMPKCLYANLFGPTEVTDICAYYIVDRPFGDDESIPIGKACRNCDVFVVDEDGKEVTESGEGELYVRGTFLALGYYNNPEKTAEFFVQNPLNKSYPETVYRTGDIVRFNARGELEYVSRRDFQIKHMGYRIELGEIEAAANSAEGVSACACVYDAAEDKIVCVFEGKKVDENTLRQTVESRLPKYMHPSVYLKLKAMPYNRNGKIDRKLLAAEYKEMLVKENKK